MKLNLLVLKTADPSLLMAQYQQLGLTFVAHQHGKGPVHYAWEKNGFVFEIYPLSVAAKKADASLRLGFEIEQLETVLQDLQNSNWVILKGIQTMPWGQVAVVQDLDGRKVELKQQVF